MRKLRAWHDIPLSERLGQQIIKDIKPEGTERICAHDINWSYRKTCPEFFDPGSGEPELPESEIEHIQSMLIENYVSGELCYLYVDDRGKDHEIRGWWSIEKD